MIKVLTLGNLSAVSAYKKYKTQKQNDKDKLAEAKKNNVFEAIAKELFIY